MTQKTETKRLAEKYDMTEKKVQRIKKAVRLSYGKEMTHEQILEEFDSLSRRQTITEYLNHPVADEFKAPYSAKESYEIQKQFEENFEDLQEKTQELVEEVLERGDYKERARAISELRKVNKDVAEFAEKIGVLDTEPEEHKHEHEGVPPVQIVTAGSEAAVEDNDDEEREEEE